MSEQTRISQRINAVIEDLNRWQSIPANYESILEERLFLVCKPPDRLKREKTRRPKIAYNLHARQKRARDVYLEVLTKFPLTFLPFLLVVSPGTCSHWKAGEVERNLKSCIPLQLNRRHEDCFENIAKSKKVTESVIYQKIKHLLFPSLPCLRPKTIADPKDAWLYDAADVYNSRSFFSEDLFKAIESSVRRSHEKESRLHKTTHCIRMSFSHSDQQDAMIRLDIGFNDEIVKALFPDAWIRFKSKYGTWVLSEQKSSEFSESHVYDNAYFTFQGAYVPNIQEVFGPHIHQAIEESQLRKWEVDSFMPNTTDCISLDIGRSQPYDGTMSLRVCSSHAIFMATKIYSCDD